MDGPPLPPGASKEVPHGKDIFVSFTLPHGNEARAILQKTERGPGMTSTHVSDTEGVKGFGEQSAHVPGQPVFKERLGTRAVSRKQ